MDRPVAGDAECHAAVQAVAVLRRWWIDLLGHAPGTSLRVIDAHENAAGRTIIRAMKIIWPHRRHSGPALGRLNGDVDVV